MVEWIRCEDESLIKLSKVERIFISRNTNEENEGAVFFDIIAEISNKYFSICKVTELKEAKKFMVDLSKKLGVFVLKI